MNRSRRHSIQCLDRSSNDLADYITSCQFTRRLSAVIGADDDDSSDVTVSRSDVVCGLVSPPAELQRQGIAVSNKSSRKTRRNGLAAKASSLFLTGVTGDARRKSLSEKNNVEAIIRASLELQRQFALASCEVFTFKFETTETPPDTQTDSQTVPALKDFSLGQMMVGPLEQRGLLVDQVDVYLEASNTPLPLSCDCFRLAGSVLHVRPKEDKARRTLSHVKSSSFSAFSSNISQKHNSTAVL